MELTQIKNLLIDLFDKDFTITTRQRPLVYMRAVYYRLCKDFTPYSLTDIGASVDKDHASVIYGLKTFKQFKLWEEDYYLDVYAKARLEIKNKYNFGNPYIHKTYREKYNDLLLKHILLKEKYHKIKTTLEKIS